MVRVRKNLDKLTAGERDAFLKAVYDLHIKQKTYEVFPRSYRFDDGYLHVDPAPGLGVDIDEDAAARFPYRRAYLPVNRLEDGTMHSW